MNNPTTIARYSGLVLAVHPTTRGFGWVLFENAHTPAAWAIVHARVGREQRLLMRFKTILDRYEPKVLVLEAFEDCTLPRSPRIQRLCEAMIREAGLHEIHTSVYERGTIRMVFQKSGAYTREQIAQVIAKSVDDFRHRLPPARKRWTSEDHRQCLFDAAALAITYFAVIGEADFGA